MTEDFVHLIEKSNNFFRELAENNNRDWFAPKKSFFTTEIQRPAERFSALLAEELSQRTKRSYKAKVFRIHRDIRFSKDKRPYNTHLHLLWSQTRPGPAPGWFFGSAADYLTMGCGLMKMEKAGLDRFRTEVADRGQGLVTALQTAADEVGATLAEYGPAALKRVPRPFPADHPRAELLKRKGLAVSAPLGADWQARGLPEAALRVVGGLMPVWAWLDGIFPVS
ncbi:MAG: DUF2461 domain-containing protein [Marinibacterium sp.]